MVLDRRISRLSIDVRRLLHTQMQQRFTSGRVQFESTQLLDPLVERVTFVTRMTMKRALCSDLDSFFSFDGRKTRFATRRKRSDDWRLS